MLKVISYHCGESCSSNMVSECHALNLVMPIESSNVEQKTPKEKESKLLGGIVKDD